MKKPDGAIDLIGTGMQIGLGVIDLIKEFAPSEEQKEINHRARKVRIAVRLLKHRYRNVPVENYVKVNFSTYTEDERKELIEMLQKLLNRI